MLPDSMTTRVSLTDLDDHALSLVFKYCSQKSLACLSATCKRFHEEIPEAIRMYGLRVHLQHDTYPYQLESTMKYRKYITSITASTIGIHMIPFYSLTGLRRLRLTRIRALASDAQRLIAKLPHLQYLHISKIVAAQHDTVFDMTQLPTSLETVSFMFDMPRVYIHALPTWKHLHVHCSGNGYATLMDLGTLESLFVYGSVILVNCPRNTTLKKVWFESPDLLYHNLLDCLPRKMDRLTLHCRQGILLWDNDIETKILRIHSRMVYLQHCLLPTKRLVIFADFLMSSRQLALDSYTRKTLIVQSNLVTS